MDAGKAVLALTWVMVVLTLMVAAGVAQLHSLNRSLRKLTQQREKKE